MQQKEKSRKKDCCRKQKPLTSEKRDRVNDAVSSARMETSHGEGDAAVDVGEPANEALEHGGMMALGEDDA